MPRHLVPRLIAAVVALAGLALILFGGLRATALAPSPTLTGTARLQGTAALVDTATGVLDGDSPQVRVQVVASDPQRAVFIGVGRAQDVEAYVAGAAHAQVTGVDGTALRVADTAGRATVDDPAGSDVWAASARGHGTVSLTWPRTLGQWRLVAATDGADPPAAVTLTWTRTVHASTAPALIAIGLVLLVAGGVIALVTRPRPAPADLDDDEDADLSAQPSELVTQSVSSPPLPSRRALRESGRRGRRVVMAPPPERRPQGHESGRADAEERGSEDTVLLRRRRVP